MTSVRTRGGGALDVHQPAARRGGLVVGATSLRVVYTAVPGSRGPPDTSGAQRGRVTDVLLVDDATRRRRAGRVALVLAHRRATGFLTGRPRRRFDICTAAEVLTALGARIEVHSPAVAWPRPGAGRLVVANRVSRLDDLALVTVVPDLVVSPDQPRDEAGLGRFDAARFRAAVEGNATVCPVAVRYRTEDGTDLTALLAGEEDLTTAIRRALSVRDLVVEVHLVPALPPGDGDPRSLATLAEYAIAGRLDLAAASACRTRRPAGR